MVLSWAGRARGPFLGATALGLGLLAAVLLVASGGEAAAAGGVLLFVAVVVACFVEVRTEVGAAGVTVRCAPFGWPRQRVVLADIEAVEVIDLRPWRWGGWGYRGSLRLGGRAAWVVRRGPALELQLRGGRRLAVTVVDADEAAAVLNGLLARTAATPRSG